MNRLMVTLALLTTLASLQAAVLPQEAERPRPPAQAQDPQPPKPSGPEPRDAPPPPPAALPKPPSESPRADQRRDSTDGQWVYTEQYGWVWMPYGERYTHLPPDGSPPNMYVYEPEVGWCWVVAPWLWGWGPSPYFGGLGYRHYGWWGIGLGRWYGFGGSYGYRSWVGPRYWHGGRWMSRGGFRSFSHGVRR